MTATTDAPAPTAEVIPFSRLVRERSSGSHRDSEGAGFMHGLLKGEATRDDYIALVSQHWAIYEALEGVEPAMREVALVAPFLSPALTRLPALEADLAFLIGDDWREQLQLMPATMAYAARIREVAATWPAGYIAHHYTRYLGDLSGGLHIGRVIGRQFGFETNGIGFYLFDDIADPTAFKDAYRSQLDAAPWAPGEQERVVDEVLRAYDFNTRIFEQLSARTDAA
ncbi:MAG: biliverdin-producing heme oxygenase [Yonghaparkia sp.]|nr:biliverdin-producing heme oxygenase [Microcella sp.]